jgi:ankyrin repeat protein
MNIADEILTNIVSKNLKKVKELLSANAYVLHYNTPYGWPIMHRCLSAGCVDLDLVNIYIGRGGNVNKKTDSGVSLLFLAAKMANAAEVQKLLESHGAIMSLFEKAVIYLTCGYEESEIDSEVTKLLNDNPYLTHHVGCGGYTLLHHAVANFHYSIARILVGKGAELNAITSNGQSPLGLSGEPGEDEGINFRGFLIRKGAEYAPLEKIEKMIRELSGEDVIKYFKQAPTMANAWVPSSSGPVLHCAVWLGNSIELIAFLLKLKIDPNTVNERGQTALHRVSHRTLKQKPIASDIVRLLTKNGADINIVDERGYSPLHEAASNSGGDIVKMFVELGSEINSVTNDGETVLDIINRMRFLDYKAHTVWMKAMGAVSGKQIKLNPTRQS